MTHSLLVGLTTGSWSRRKLGSTRVYMFCRDQTILLMKRTRRHEDHRWIKVEDVSRTTCAYMLSVGTLTSLVTNTNLGSPRTGMRLAT